jgi:hypothetical protein
MYIYEYNSITHVGQFVREKSVVTIGNDDYAKGDLVETTFVPRQWRTQE